MTNLAIWQCLLEFIHAFVGHLRFQEDEPPEIRKPFHPLQPGIGDLSVAEVQHQKVCMQVLQSSIGDLGIVDRKPPNVCKPFEVLQPGVSHLGPAKVNGYDLGSIMRAMNTNGKRSPRVAKSHIIWTQLSKNLLNRPTVVHFQALLASEIQTVRFESEQM